MVVMALVTTVMAGPLLSLTYPRRRVERDIAEAERVALGVVDAYRVLVVVDSPEADAQAVVLASDLVGGRRPAEVVLSHLMPYRTPRRLEVGSGLSGELLEMTRVMAELDQLAASVRAQGVAAPVLARFGMDPARELSAQVATINSDVVVVAARHPAYAALRAAADSLVTVVSPLPDRWQAVLVRAQAAADIQATLHVAAQLATARGVELVVDAGSRPSRRLSSMMDELRRHQVVARFGPDVTDTCLVVTADGADAGDAHLTVRTGPNTDAQWSPQLANHLRASQSPSQP
jgi:hypothetical protein